MFEGIVTEAPLSVHLAFMIDVDRETVVLSSGAVQPLTAANLVRTIESARVECRFGRELAGPRAG